MTLVCFAAMHFLFLLFQASLFDSDKSFTMLQFSCLELTLHSMTLFRFCMYFAILRGFVCAGLEPDLFAPCFRETADCFALWRLLPFCCAEPWWLGTDGPCQVPERWQWSCTGMLRTHSLLCYWCFRDALHLSPPGLHLPAGWRGACLLLTVMGFLPI